MTVTTMSSKGQIVIPEEIRKKLNLKPRQRFRVELTSRGNVLVIPIPLDALAEMMLEGIGQGELSTELEDMRKESEERIEGASQRLK